MALLEEVRVYVLGAQAEEAEEGVTRPYYYWWW
jgi:hypothetical protein